MVGGGEHCFAIVGFAVAVVCDNQYMGHSTAHNSIFSFGYFYILAPFFVAFGLVRMVKMLRQDSGNPAPLVILLAFGSALLIGLFILNVNVNRINMLWISYLALMVLGVIEFVQQKQRLFAAVLGIFGVLFVCFNAIYFTVWNEKIGPNFNAGLTEAIVYANTVVAPDQQIYFDADLHEPQVYCLLVDAGHPAAFIDASQSDGICQAYRQYVFYVAVDSDTDWAAADILITSLAKYTQLGLGNVYHAQVCQSFVVLVRN